MAARDAGRTGCRAGSAGRRSAAFDPLSLGKRIEADRCRIILAGDPPSPSNPPPGCRFNTRCPVAMYICRLDEPQLRPVPHGGVAACHLAESDHRPVI
ncbi:oligopeptide/dipeptide ABC transporter ATP-binding protein [Mesorhizobium sp. M0323]|uniref:oligopeptide/dipeptide ABC transporter ATP-binding protein n=1 Tax=Mesorhizobium sp. M0323 TaxID=2956938 RepID=UPI003335AB4D